MLQLLILFGGVSPEHDVSCFSAAGLIEAADRKKYRVHTVGITKDGKWLYTQAPSHEISDARSWLAHPSNRTAVLSPERGANALIVFGEDGSYSKIKVDVVFPVLHGENGEDGTVQGLLELAGLPYVGCGVSASACSMDKSLAARFAQDAGLRCPAAYVVDCEKFRADPAGCAAEAAAFHGGEYPVVVKPASTGSSVGVSIAHDLDELRSAMTADAAFGGKIIVEEYIKGREIKVALLGTDPVTVGVLCETVIENGAFNDYDLKYRSNGTHKKIPPQLSDEVSETIRQQAVTIYKALGCRGLSRADFFLKGDTVYFNEINTIPGLSKKSIFSLMLNAAGISYPEIIDRLIEDALSR